ncbi:MAG TPA: T9SS type A sorting domain-containing protein [Flavobacteriales bacterium]|nr:T9SS type A sorting domain-containing protein [Flavobacteriales bacterium]HRJ37786.1 T9SS type A sorting domain-containing protein [Flavobacteriales bacterium]
MKNNLLLLLLCLTGFNAGAQSIFFQKIIGNSGSFYSRDVIQTADTGYVVCGSSSGLGDYTANGFLMKLDKFGTRLWTKSYGGSNADWAMRVLEESDGSLVFAGYTNSTNNSGYDIWLAKTNSNGVLQWSRTYGGSDWDFGYSILKTNDGNYLIAGETYSFGNGNADGFLLKVDMNGDSLWMQTYGGPLNENARKVITLPDGSFIFTGTTNSPPSTSKDIWLVKTDAMGAVVWDRRLGSAADDEGQSIVLSRTNGEIVGVGSTDSSYSTLNSDQYYFRTDDQGMLICHFLYGGPAEETTHDVCERWNGYGIVAGMTLSYGSGFGDMICYYPHNGCFWTGGQTIGTPDRDEAWAVKETSDSGYVVVGQTENGPGFTNVYIVKAGPTMFVTPLLITEFDISSVDEVATTNSLEVYPNPFNGPINISWYGREGRNRIRLFDISGKLIAEETLYGSNGTIEPDLSAKGIYFLEIINENSGERITRRIIKGGR